MKRKGISLIVLVITIIVIIILAGAVILNLTKNNPIDSSKEAVFRNDVSSINDALSMHALGELSKTNGEFDINTMNGKVSDFVPSLTKYDEELQVVKGKLIYIGNNERRAQIVAELTGSDNSNAVVEVGGLKFNKPDTSALPESTTKAVKWDSNNIESQINLSVAKTDTSWYDYKDKKWANIFTNNNGNGAYWVWIPRYAYKIDNPHTAQAEQIHIKFLSGTSNIACDGSNLSGYIVHPAFTFGTTQLTGIWVAKYEASSSDPNRIETTGTYAGASTGGGNDTSLQVRVLPDVYSWRSISTGNAQTVSMNMTSSSGSVGTNTKVDTHQMKNVEWGAVAYLSQSQYGEEPWINPYGDGNNLVCKMKTGYAGISKNSSKLAEGDVNLATYNTTNGVKASTTGNIYGVYDMNGGARERTAAFLDNGNAYIANYGNPEHIQNNKIKPEYAKYYDIYEPGDEEKEGATFYGVGGEKLWNSVAPYNVNQINNNIIRKRLTGETYTKFSSKKGDGLWETSSTNSYYGRYTSGTNSQQWLIDTERDSSAGAQFAIGWNGDRMLIGYSIYSWFDRGGVYDRESISGVFAAGMISGNPYPTDSFRPILVVFDTN